MSKFLGFTENIKIALASVAANKVRSGLTMLGIVIGIVAVTTTMTAANGLQQSFKQSFAAFGANVFYITKMPVIINSKNFLSTLNRPNISYEQAQEFSQRFKDRAIVDITIDATKTVRYRSEIVEGVNVYGSTENQVYISDLIPETGRFFIPIEVALKRPVCVLGSEIASSLFDSVNPLGRTVRIGRGDCEVIGIMEKQGDALFDEASVDRNIYMPITTFKKLYGFNSRSKSVAIAVKPLSEIDPSDTEIEAIGVMRTVRNVSYDQQDNFSIIKLDTLLDVYNSVMGVVLLVGLMITGISLFVGGMGVMNIMLVSVTERTKEIGIRKAIGAKPASILLQFISEAIFICVIGGAVGVLLTWAITGVINALVFPAALSSSIVIVALMIATTTGVLSGLLPAWRAAKLSPVDALRYE